jgi:hypothetical protein
MYIPLKLITLGIFSELYIPRVHINVLLYLSVLKRENISELVLSPNFSEHS